MKEQGFNASFKTASRSSEFRFIRSPLLSFLRKDFKKLRFSASLTLLTFNPLSLSLTVFLRFLRSPDQKLGGFISERQIAGAGRKCDLRSVRKRFSSSAHPTDFSPAFNFPIVLFQFHLPPRRCCRGNKGLLSSGRKLEDAVKKIMERKE